ncbi:MAG: choice-of-anchor Q domain-containing protein [Deinococcota bacterium]
MTGLYLLLSTSVAQVTNLDDAGPGSLRDVVAAAADGDTITFQAGLSGTINLASGNITIDENDLTIDGSGATITLDGLGVDHVFRHIRTAAGNLTLTINNLTIQDGGATGNGGGIFGAGNVIVINSTITNNRAGSFGGGIYSEGDVTIINSALTGNDAFLGGGIFNNGTVTVVNSLVARNRVFSGLNGGGIYSVGNVTAINSTVTGNEAASGGSGITSFDIVTLSNSLVLGNDPPASTQINVLRAPILNNSAYGFAAGESTGDAFVGLTVADVFVAPVAVAALLGDYRLAVDSPAIDAGNNADAAGITTDLDGNARIQGAAVDMGAYESAIASPDSGVINPNQDIQIRNGNSISAEVITSNGFEVLSYGPFNRGQDVVLEYLVRNPGAQVLELGEFVLPSFLSVFGDALPESLGSFESALLQVSVDTSTAGTFAGQVSLASNDPDTNENPFVFDLIVRIGNEPANALYVLSGVELDDTTITSNQQNVPVYSAHLLVPEDSADITINSLTINTDDFPALRDVSSLTLLIDGGTRGIQDNRDVVLATLNDPSSNTITFEFDERTLQPNLPLWVLVVADF